MRVGPYEIEREVGRGGMGVVLAARAPDGTRVAVKLIRAPAPHQDAVARFDRERRLLAGLGEAAGFVPLLDAGLEAGSPYLVMPFVGGGSLRERLARPAPLPREEAVAIVATIARAVGRAHRHGIVHRDLKPENVLFTEDGRPLVSDLGLAKHFSCDEAGSGRSVALSVTGELRGTFGYMAPEQARDAKSAGPQADVFSLGAILYECLAGRPAFAGDNALRVLDQVERGEVEPLGRACPDVPRALALSVERALASEPERRFADGEAFAVALEASERERRRGHPALFAAALGSLALVAAPALAWVARPRASPSASPTAALPSRAPTRRPTTPPPRPAAPVAVDVSGEEFALRDASGALLGRGTVASSDSPYQKEGPFKIARSALGNVDADPDLEAVLLANQEPYYPAMVVVAKGNGDVVARYWNPGRLDVLLLHDADGDGVQEIYVGGVNNDAVPGQLVPIVARLDARRMQGEAPPRRGRLMNGVEVWYQAFGDLEDAGAVVRLSISEGRLRCEVASGVVLALRPDCGEVVSRERGGGRKE